MLFGDSVITPTGRTVPFGDDDFQAVYEDDELRPLVPHVDEMLGDINGTWKFHEEADKFGEDVPEWDDPDYREASKYAEQVRATLIDAGCIFAEHDRYDEEICFIGLAEVLKASFDLCVELADDLKVSFRVSQRAAARH